MRPLTIRADGIIAEIAGGWAMPACEDDDADDMLKVRLDDGNAGVCRRNTGIDAGDRIYTIVYRGHRMRGHVGVDIHDATTGTDHVESRPALRQLNLVFPAMAAAPAVVLALLAIAWLSGARSTMIDVAMLCMLLPITVPVALGLMDARRTFRENRASHVSLDACRRLARGAIGQDVATWKESLLGHSPSEARWETVVVRGVSCRIVEGLFDEKERTIRIDAGRRTVPVPLEASSTCMLKDGALVHALVPNGRIPERPLAVADPLSSRTWMDGSLVGGMDGRPYRQHIRSALGRAAWQAVTRQRDEVGHRRRNAYRA